MTRIKRLQRSYEGAVAIEYGLIAGIVALGIVSALVSAKGGLNGVFDLTGTQMNVSQTQSNSANAALWSGKGIVSSTTTIAPITGRIIRSYVFDDGSKATYTRNDPSQPAFDEVTTYDPVTKTEYRSRADADGNANLYQKATYDPTGSYVVARESTTAASNFAGTPPVPIRYALVTYDASGTILTNTGAITASAEHAAGSINTNESLKYFRDISK